MQTIAERRKKSRIIKFVGILIVSTALLWLVGLILWKDNPIAFNISNQQASAESENDSTEDINPNQQRELLRQDEVLHSYLNELQKLDESYSLLLTDTADKNRLTEMDSRIASAEQAFRKSIDSVAKEAPAYPNREDEILFVNMIASFRLALENRRSTHNLRNAINTDKAVLQPDQKLLLKAGNELLAKDTKIATLENQLKLLQINLDKRAAMPATVVIKEKEREKEKDLSKDIVIEKDNKIATLTTRNNALQKEYDRLLKQVSEAGKKIEIEDNSDKNNRYTSLESKIDELNTELRLAQVDCNLARADASQIISNSKQRRLLLNEALTILNGLTKSENAYIQKKVKDKRARLNQVATTYRD